MGILKKASETQGCLCAASCSVGTGCSTPAVPRTRLALFPSYSKLVWLRAHGGVIPMGKTSPELVAFGFVKSWQPCFHSGWVSTQKRAHHKTSYWSRPMRKVLASRKRLCEEFLRAQRMQSKGQWSNKPKKNMIILSGAQRMHVMNVCGERWDEASSLCVYFWPFSLDFCELLSW